MQVQNGTTEHYNPLLVKVANSGGIFTGIFTEEIVIGFLILLEKAAFTCFYEVHTKILSDYSHQYHECMRSAFGTFKTWNYQTRQEEVEKVIQAYPEIVKVYKPCVVIYVREEYKHSREGEDLTIVIPPFNTFLLAFYRNLASDEFVLSGEYFKGGRMMEKKITNMDAMRFALREVTKDNVSSRNSVATKQQDSIPRIVRSLRDVTQVYDDISPDDSASNVSPISKTPSPLVNVPVSLPTFIHSSPNETPKKVIRVNLSGAKKSMQGFSKMTPQMVRSMWNNGSGSEAESTVDTSSTMFGSEPEGNGDTVSSEGNEGDERIHRESIVDMSPFASTTASDAFYTPTPNKTVQ